MKLRAIRLTNLRRFAGQTAAIEGLGDGLSVIAAPNESGKSTVFDALQALFFAAHGSRARDVA
jgi:chromosome segregation ATPase